jgi:signal transduction histidine kinase
LAAIGRVVAGLAHEIRNPIAAMRLKAENALALGEDHKDRALSAMLGQIDRLDTVLRRLLTATERERPCRKVVALADFAGSCVGAHRELARANDVDLRWHADGGTCHFDPDQVRSALDNLILNALQAAPRGTAVSVTTSRNAEGVVLSVRDEGPGPAAAISEHLFEPFVTGRAGGTGLGLSIVREVAEAHGGTARLAPSPTGTLFEIEIPCPSS